jgi:hypothetical protein
MKKIAICSSVSSYKEVVTLKNELATHAVGALLPDLSERMERENNYEFMAYAEEFDDNNPLVKKDLIDAHFSKIAASDGVLIVNQEKHGLAGYIGPNVLMELTVGYWLKKPLFLLHQPDKKLPAYGEIMALQPIVLDGDLKKLVAFFTE